MPSHKDSARQSTYLYEMMQRLGIEPGEGVLPRLSMAYMTAYRRCQTCPAKEACRDWLDSMPQSMSVAPTFCPNTDILFELRINQPGHPEIAVDYHVGNRRHHVAARLGQFPAEYSASEILVAFARSSVRAEPNACLDAGKTRDHPAAPICLPPNRHPMIPRS
jgi:hypothetical protein